MLTQMVGCEILVYVDRSRSLKSLVEMVVSLVVLGLRLNYVRLKANSKPVGLGFHKHIIQKKLENEVSFQVYFEGNLHTLVDCLALAPM